MVDISKQCCKVNYLTRDRGRNSVVECWLPKPNVVGSNPIARFNPLCEYSYILTLKNGFKIKAVAKDAMKKYITHQLEPHVIESLGG